jgi:hypothetical protein
MEAAVRGQPKQREAALRYKAVLFRSQARQCSETGSHRHPVPTRRRLAGLELGFVLLLNEARIVALFYAYRSDRALFVLVHSLVWLDDHYRFIDLTLGTLRAPTVSSACGSLSLGRSWSASA